MGFNKYSGAFVAGVMMSVLYVQPVVADDMTPAEIAGIKLIDIPLVLADVDPSDGATTLWAKGDEPANSRLARMTVKPVEVAALISATAEPSEPLLWRAFAGGGIVTFGVEDLSLRSGPRYYCGGRKNASLSCFLDEDGNGSFDHVAQAISERGAKPYHITLIRQAKALDKPLPYRVLPDAQRPVIKIELRNCDKDYDRPRYAAISTEDRDAPVTPSGFAWLSKDSSFASCRRGNRMYPPPDQAASIPNGGYMAAIGPLAFTVGPKNDPRLALVGPVDLSALYRLEGATLVRLAIGRTPNQAKLIAMKEFPYPMMMTQAGSIIQRGEVAVGGLLASIPFRHAYRGKLAQDVTISTLFGKRSLAAGTIVYGFPGQSSITYSRGGIPQGRTVGDDEYRKIDLTLTWCAPVHQPVTNPAKRKPNDVGQNGWSAACVPHSAMGGHTIIADMQPAFAISGISYSTETSSNSGAPPIVRDDATEFERPLRIEYRFAGREGEFIAVNEQIYFGDELTSSRPQKLFTPEGAVQVKLAGAETRLAMTANGALSIKSNGAPVIGAAPTLTWDRKAEILQQMRKMGLVPADANIVLEDNAEGGMTARVIK